MRKIIIAIIISTLTIPLLTAPILANAQQPTVSLEEQRRQRLATELSLTIPPVSDNPNHIITFRNPSDEEPVRLEIDGQGFKTITSPYTLPSLGIGKHVLTFRFTDSEETEQTFDETITIVPRPPIIDAPVTISITEITLKGTALASSTVDVYMSSETKHYPSTVQVNADGTWTTTYKEDFQHGIYNVIAITRKNGFASSISETIVFEISRSGTTTNTTNKPSPISFNFNSLLEQDPVEIAKSNPDLLILIGSTFLLGIILASTLTRALNNRVHKNIEGMFMNKLSKKGSSEIEDMKNQATEIKAMTLREKFEKAGLKKEKAQETSSKDQPKENETKEGNSEESNEKPLDKKKVISKEEFLEEYKDHDPDNEKGEEKKTKKNPETKVNKGEKKKSSNLMNSISISLTSKPKK